VYDRRDHLGLRNAGLSLVVSPPADDRSTLILVPLNVFLAGLDVGDVSQTESTGESGDSNHRVGGDVRKPDGLVVDLVDHLAREVAATGNAWDGVEGGASKGIHLEQVYT